MQTVNVAISASDENTSIVIRVTNGEQSRTILRGSLAELQSEEERRLLADILAAVRSFAGA